MRTLKEIQEQVNDVMISNSNVYVISEKYKIRTRVLTSANIKKWHEQANIDWCES